MGVRCVEHGNLLDATSVELLLSNEVFLVPSRAYGTGPIRRGSGHALGPP
ncbi:hypothetical protein ACIF6K_01525 [Streptomyces sp. NPDC085942]